MNLTAAGKAFAQMFPTRERFRSYLAWCEAEKKKKLRLKRQRDAIQACRDEIAMASIDTADDDYDPVAQDIWEQVNKIK